MMDIPQISHHLFLSLFLHTEHSRHTFLEADGPAAPEHWHFVSIGPGLRLAAAMHTQKPTITDDGVKWTFFFVIIWLSFPPLSKGSSNPAVHAYVHISRIDTYPKKKASSVSPWPSVRLHTT